MVIFPEIEKIRIILKITMLVHLGPSISFYLKVNSTWKRFDCIQLYKPKLYSKILVLPMFKQ